MTWKSCQVHLSLLSVSLEMLFAVRSLAADAVFVVAVPLVII